MRVTLATLGRRATKAAALPAGVVTRGRPGDVVILLYHRVGRSGSEIELAPGAFDRQLGHLARTRKVVSLDDALAGRGGVVVTFDDGYRDFVDEVVPALVRHRVPAVLYLATGLVDGPGTDRLSWRDLRDAVSTGLVTLGSHTHGHVNLRHADASTAAEEMRRSKALIEDELAVPCLHFAYPWGVASQAAEAAARALFASAALRAWKTNRRGRMDRHRLGRTPVLSSDGDVFFRAKVAGALNGEALFYRLLGRGPWRYR